MHVETIFTNDNWNKRLIDKQNDINEFENISFKKYILKKKITGSL